MANSRERSWLTTGQSRQVARRLARDQRGIVARRQLLALGVPHWFVRRELAAARWQRTGRQTLAVYTGSLDAAAQRQVAVLEVGPRAALGGLSALQEAGLKVDSTAVHVAVPRGGHPRPRSSGPRRRRRRPAPVAVHETRRFREEDLLAGAMPRRSQPAVAAVQAALWAVSDRQAQLWVLMAVQQRLVTVAALTEAMAAVRRHPRRRMLLRLLQDVAGGVQSMNELDVARDFRRRGFPEPDRQEVRRRPDGRQYLDVSLSAYRLVFEIDGAGHDDPLQTLSDVLRDLDVSADGDLVVRIPVATYHLDPERILDGIARLLTARGWTPPLRQAV